MNNLQVFKNEEFGSIRTVTINDEVWFVGKDVATALGYAKPLNALATHVDKDDSLKQGLIDSIGRRQNTILINESGLYALIFGSKLDSAKRFKHWVTSEVLPSIRKHGVYAVDDLNKVKQQKAMLLLQIYEGGQEGILASKELTRIEVEEATAPLIAENEELKPKASYYDIVLQSPSLVKIGVIASDYGMSANKMNIMLHEFGVQYKQSDIWLLYSKYRGKGYTQTKTHVYGDDKTKVWMYWTQKGRLFIYDTLKAQGILPLVEQYD